MSQNNWIVWFSSGEIIWLCRNAIRLRRNAIRSRHNAIQLCLTYFDYVSTQFNCVYERNSIVFFTQFNNVVKFKLSKWISKVKPYWPTTTTKNQKGQKGKDKRLQKLKHKEAIALRLGGGGGGMTKCNDVDSVIINSPPKMPFFLKVENHPTTSRPSANPAQTSIKRWCSWVLA